MGAPTAVHGAQSSRQAGPVATLPLAPWVVLGWCGAVGMVLTGTRIGAVPDPHLALWWFSLPSGGSPLDSIGFYALAGRDGGGVARGGPPRAGRPAERRPGVGRSGRVGAATALRTSSVQPGPVQLRGPGAPDPPRTQSLCGRALRPRPRSPAVRRGQRVAGHHLPLRALLRGVEQGGGGRGRRIPGRAGDGLPGPGVGGRGPGDGLPSSPGAAPGHRPRDGPVARGPQPAGSVQLRGLRS